MKHAAAVMLLTVSLATPARAAEGQATAVIKKANARFQELLAKKAPPEQITTELRALFDIRDLAKRALVDHWDKLKPAERDEIVTLLQQLVEKSYTKSLKNNLKYRVDYLKELPAKDQVTVKTVIHAGGPAGLGPAGGGGGQPPPGKKKRPVEITVDYVLVKEAAGWRAIDVVTDDVSMLKNYRSQFNRIIAKEGVAGLLAKMRKKLAEEK